MRSMISSVTCWRLPTHVGFEQFDLAGFSLGGLIAQRLALTHGPRAEETRVAGNGRGPYARRA